MKKDFAIIGLGAFGQMLCHKLTERGANVIPIDKDEEQACSFRIAECDREDGQKNQI